MADSYGSDKQQHTFTLELANSSTLRIKGRNLYATRVYRKLWEDEDLRYIARDEDTGKPYWYSVDSNKPREIMFERETGANWQPQRQMKKCNLDYLVARFIALGLICCHRKAYL